jgi:hypothetical protein
MESGQPNTLDPASPPDPSPDQPATALPTNIRAILNVLGVLLD